MNELDFEFLSKFGSLRSGFASALEQAKIIFRQGQGLSQQSDDSAQLAALAYYESLMNMPVARKDEKTGKQSLLKDDVWDFNPNYPHAARNVQGAKLRMDWTKYPHVSPAVILEMKVAFYLYYLAPNHIYSGTTRKGNKKANTVAEIFRHGMKFVDQLSLEDAKELGAHYVVRAELGIKDFDKISYEAAAKSYDFSFSDNLQVFFKIVRSVYLADNVFGGFLPYVELSSLKWKHKPEVKAVDGDAPVVTEVLPNYVFEVSSHAASMMVVDFLDALREPIIDQDTLNRRNAQGFKRAESYGLSQRLMKMYTFIRLKQKGYSFEQMDSILGGMPAEFLTQRVCEGSDTISKPTLVTLSNGRINEALRVYLNLVNYACCYLVAQYTGMRPSELAEIRLDVDLENDDIYWLIKSRVVKHRNSYGGMFDDTWIAIPIVRDAIAVAKIMARYKQSPFLFASVETVAPGAEAVALDSNGITYQFDLFFRDVLPEDEYQALVFKPYTLRHTLAYQLYRADVGLPFISHQLKHFGDIAGGYENRRFSSVTLVYGHIGDMIEMGGRTKGKSNQFRHMAEKEVVRLHYDPDGSFAGQNALAHRERNQAIFAPYREAGHTLDEFFDALVAQGIAVVSIGTGMCYGGRREDFDDSLPCIGSLRCNPRRCSNSVITKSNAPKWREIYNQNKILLTDPAYHDRIDQINEIMEEARGVLEDLGEDLELPV